MPEQKNNGLEDEEINKIFSTGLVLRCVFFLAIIIVATIIIFLNNKVEKNTVSIAGQIILRKLKVADKRPQERK